MCIGANTSVQMYSCHWSSSYQSRTLQSRLRSAKTPANMQWQFAPVLRTCCQLANRFSPIGHHPGRKESQLSSPGGRSVAPSVLCPSLPGEGLHAAWPGGCHLYSAVCRRSRARGNWSSVHRHWRLTTVQGGASPRGCTAALHASFSTCRAPQADDP